MGTGHDGWIYQGRQYHQWFGHGTKPEDEPNLPPLQQRIDGLANTLVASLSAASRRHPATRMGTADRARFTRLMLAMARSHAASLAAFAEHFFDASASRPFVQPFQQAARLVATAKTQTDLRDASDSLAKGVLAVGMDQWLPFMRDADRRIEGRAGPQIMLARATPAVPAVTSPSPGSLPGSPLPPSPLPLPAPARALIAAAGALLALLTRPQAEAEVRAAAQRFGLDLTQAADARAAIAYVTVMHAGPRVLAQLTGGKADNALAAEVVMELERAHPGLLAAAFDGVPQAVQAVRDAIASAASGIETHDDEERALVDEMAKEGKSFRQIQAALADLRARKRMQETGSPRDGKTGPPAFIPPDVLEKIPLKFGMGIPNKATKRDKNKEGWRWFSPVRKGDSVRIDKGNLKSGLPSQRVDHVIVQSGGVILGRDGKPIKGGIDDDPENAHIPLEEYRKWQRWNHP